MSQSLTKAEQNYTQLERECLACEKNRLYLLERHFEIYNDHKALVIILDNTKPRSLQGSYTNFI